MKKAQKRGNSLRQILRLLNFTPPYLTAHDVATVHSYLGTTRLRPDPL